MTIRPHEFSATDFNWEGVFKYASKPMRCEGFTGSIDGATIDDVAEDIASVNGENDGASWDGVFRLKDGRFLFVTASCDYTGWGCGEYGQSWVAGDLETLVQFGLGNDERHRLGF